MTLSIAQVRRAAASLSAVNKPVTVPNLKDVLKVGDSELEQVLRINGIKQEIGLISTHLDRFALYRAAAARLAEAGKPVTIEALTKEMKLKRGNVTMWLGRHPAVKAELKVVSKAEAKRLQRLSLCQAAVAKLVRERQRVTVNAIARLTGKERSSLYREFKRDTELAQLLSSDAMT